MASSDFGANTEFDDLPTRQRRLRHLRSISARNLSVKSGDDLSSLETCFTVHSVFPGPVLYRSEKVQGSLNPTWRSFNLNHVPGLNTEVIAKSQCVICVWGCHRKTEQLCIKWTVDLFGLKYIGEKLQYSGSFYSTDTLLFGMFGGYYAAPSAQPAPGTDITSCMMKVDQASVRDSYSSLSLSRVQTVLRAICQTRTAVRRVRADIQSHLHASQSLTSKRESRELFTLRISMLRKDLEQRTKLMRSETERLEAQQAATHQRDVSMQSRFESLDRDRGDRLHDKKSGYFDFREDLIKTGAMLVQRRKQLISELALIYPISEHKDKGAFRVAGVTLPNSEDFNSKDETMIACALGYTCHLVMMISEYLDVPLRYVMDHRASRSRVHDHILDKLTDKDRDFPLYSRGKEKFQFNYGVYLLNKNIAQLRYYCGLGTTDLRLTLPNLKSLLELRLGVPHESGNVGKAMTSLPGQHIPVPPNLGGPQSSKSRRILRPRNSTSSALLTHDEMTQLRVDVGERSKTVSDVSDISIQNKLHSASQHHHKSMMSEHSNFISPPNTSECHALSNSSHTSSVHTSSVHTSSVHTQNPTGIPSHIRSPSSQKPSDNIGRVKSPSGHSRSSSGQSVGAYSLSSGHSRTPSGGRVQDMEITSSTSQETIEVGAEAVEMTASNASNSIDVDLLVTFNSDGDSIKSSDNNSLYEEPDMVVKKKKHENKNNSSKFKMWSKDRQSATSPGSVQAAFSSDDEDSDQDGIERHKRAFTLDLGDLYKSRSCDDLDSSDSSEDGEHFHGRKHPTMSNSYSHNQISTHKNTHKNGVKLKDNRNSQSQQSDFLSQEDIDIGHRTDALTSGFSSFKLAGNRTKQSPQSLSHKKIKPHQGALDDCLADSS